MKIRSTEYFLDGRPADMIHLDANENGSVDADETVWEVVKKGNRYELNSVNNRSFGECDKVLKDSSYKFEDLDETSFIYAAATYDPTYLFFQLDCNNMISLAKKLYTIQQVRPEIYDMFVKFCGVQGQEVDSFLSKLKISQISLEHAETIEYVQNVFFIIDFLAQYFGGKLDSALTADNRAKLNSIIVKNFVDPGRVVPGWQMNYIGAHSGQIQVVLSKVAYRPAVSDAKAETEVDPATQFIEPYYKKNLLSADGSVYGRIIDIEVMVDGKDAIFYVERPLPNVKFVERYKSLGKFNDFVSQNGLRIMPETYVR